MTSKNFNYKKIRKLRESLTEEVSAQTSILTVDHLKLIEMRVQTAIMADLDDDEVEKERSNFKKDNG